MKRFVLSCFVIMLLYSQVFALEYTLDDLYKMALERSEKIKISEEDLFIAEKGKDKALSALLPKLSGVGGYTHYRDNKTNDNESLIQSEDATNWGFRLDQSFSLAGREIIAYGVAKKGIGKSRYDLFAVKEGYIYTVTSTYYDLMKAKKVVDIARQNVERLTKYRDAASTRLKVGEVTKTTLLRAEAELSGAQSDLIKAENVQKFAKAVLARVVGIRGDFEVKETQDLLLDASRHDDINSVVKGCTLPTIDCLKETAYAERAELKSSDLQKSIADATVKFTKGSYWPTVAVEGVYQKKIESPETQSLIRDNLYGGVRLVFPFFEGGLRAAEVQEAAAKKRQADYTFEDIKKSVTVEVENAYLDFLTQKGTLKSLEDQLVFAKDNFNAVTKQFEYGLAHSIDVMDANTLLVTAQRQLADVIYNYQLSVARLRRTTGTLLQFVVGNNGVLQKP
ncbi:MAG: Outer membrane protein TolC precursor [Syntrophorhabdus sp. PtaU1.Bin058]|nr:MAG: Outer membrane protein TolC precursor [Syntrophorhabdus sp. PtaU1.Bin058]